MKKWLRILACVLVLLAIVELAVGQARRRGSRRQVETDRYNVPTWDLHPTMPKDVFTFARIRYTSENRGWRGGGWDIDYRDADLNLSYRLNQMTALKVDPEGIVIELTDPNLADYPFIYLIEPGSLYLSEAEIAGLRQYLSNGGFLMVDDFWGEDEWEGFYDYFSQVFPGKELVELDVTHPIFNTPFPLKRKPQIPNVQTGTESVWFNNGVTWERDDAQVPHYRALFDDNGRMMAIICHNTDLGDGWEEEATSPEYFREFSEKSAYPLGINIIFFAMTQ